MPTIRLALLATASAFAVTACQSSSEAVVRLPLLVDTVVASTADYASKAALTGEIEALLSTDLSFQVAGQVTERLVGVGDHVEEGQVLARIDPAEQIADREAALTSLSVARSQLAQAELTLERQQALFDQGIVTGSTYDSAVEAVATSKSALDGAQASLSQAQEDVAQTELRSFAKGIVTLRSVEVGQVLQAGQTAFTVANDGPREAVLYVNEGILTDTFANQAFTVSMIDAPDVNAPATLKEISPTVNQETGSVKVTLTIATPPSDMSLGAVVQTIASYQSIRAIVLPANALTTSGGVAAVWVVQPDSKKVSLRPIELTAFDSEILVVAKGIEDGERVVTAGANLLYPDQIVDFRE